MMSVMRYPDGHKQAVRERIVAAAARALRESGLSGVSIPALMKGAGLTHGGFYAHFENRDALVAAAVQAAGADTAQGVFGDGRTLEQALDHYLSPEHLAHPEFGCVVAALGAEGPRHPEPVRHAFAQVARGLVALVQAKLTPKKSKKALSDEALRLTSTMLGAVVLGRLVDDPQLSRRILRVARASARS
jgi:TetR/AcrR family transcriptional regulator, transcriptional repressor for nem operon